MIDVCDNVNVGDGTGVVDSRYGGYDEPGAGSREVVNQWDRGGLHKTVWPMSNGGAGGRSTVEVIWRWDSGIHNTDFCYVIECYIAYA